ncbi:MAG TPA: SDR family NAD(P)-dependent oxidoreductase [Acidimicrobiales bacterium]|nr:SDR family NAD(P)-dependent oxidoreductase [Acidimicrobiales bacterium]
MGLLEGRRAVVTGGGSGIGAATCRRFADEGARVAVLDVDGTSGERVAGSVGGVAVDADVVDGDALTAAFDRAAAALGGLDTVVNNAGTGNVLPLHDYPDDEWDRLLAVNLKGVFNGTRAAVPHLRAAGPGATIVNVSSLSGLRPTRGEAPYSAAKAGVVALTMSAALEYGPGVRVNCVSPGFIRTPLTEVACADDATRGELEAATPLGRLGTAEEVAATIAFLCSDLAAYVTGANLVVDGGSALVNAQVDPMLRRFTGQ